MRLQASQKRLAVHLAFGLRPGRGVGADQAKQHRRDRQFGRSTLPTVLLKELARIVPPDGFHEHIDIASGRGSTGTISMRPWLRPEPPGVSDIRALRARASTHRTWSRPALSWKGVRRSSRQPCVAAPFRYYWRGLLRSNHSSAAHQLTSGWIRKQVNSDPCKLATLR